MDSNAAPPTASAPVPLAMRGNYQTLRQFFFAFRDLAHQQLLNVGGLTRSDAAFINEHIRSSAQWSLAHAHLLYLLLGRWEREMRVFGHDYRKLVPPSQMGHLKPQVLPTAPPLIRQESITLGDGCLLLYLRRDNILHLRVKELFSDRTWDGRLNSWRLPQEHSAGLLAFAREHALAVGDSAALAMENYLNNVKQSYAHERVELALPLKMKLFDYQTVGADFAIRMRRSLIADEMGLGKTPTAIAAALGWNRWPVLVISPKSLRGNWKHEIQQWTSCKVQVADPKVMRHLPQLIERRECDFLLINYEGVKTHFVSAVLPATGTHGPTVVFNGRERLFRGVIIDEAHELKNPKTERIRVIHSLVRNMEYRALLTGTPFVNQVNDLRTLVDLLGYLPAFGGRKGWAEQFGTVRKDQFDSGRGGSALTALNNRLRQVCMIRRQKHQVLTQLPDKLRTVVPIELDNRRDYDLAYHNLHEYLRQHNLSPSALAAEMLVQMALLKQLSCRGKVKQAVEYVNGILEQRQKVVLFVWHKETIATLRRYWPDLLEISGSVSDDQVDANKALFQNYPDRHPLIVITYKRGGVGHTLTAASHVVFLELGWNPKDQDQAEDRLHRIGQKDNVTCHYLLGVNTIDQWIYELIQSKRTIGKESVGGTEDISISIQATLSRRLQHQPAPALAG